MNRELSYSKIWYAVHPRISVDPIVEDEHACKATSLAIVNKEGKEERNQDQDCV